MPSTLPQTMKSVYFNRYGNLNNLSITQVPLPKIDDDEILVKNYASSINFANSGHIKGKPFVIRAATGFGSPKLRIPGSDVAGVVVQVGSKVRDFEIGDEVMADVSDCGFGAFAQFVACPQKVTVHKPTNLSFCEAATLPLAAGTALGAIKQADIRPRQEVLVVGATGSVGPFVVQIAKSLGAEVTAVCNGKKADFVHSQGADYIVDYTTEDFTQTEKRYDAIFGVAGYKTMLEYKKLLHSNGVYINIGGSIDQLKNAFLTGFWVFLASNKKCKIFAHTANKKNLLELKNLAQQQKIQPTIQTQFDLENIKNAFELYDSGRLAGKIVIDIHSTD